MKKAKRPKCHDCGKVLWGLSGIIRGREYCLKCWRHRLGITHPALVAREKFLSEKEASR